MGQHSREGNGRIGENDRTREGKRETVGDGEKTEARSKGATERRRLMEVGQEQIARTNNDTTSVTGLQLQTRHAVVKRCGAKRLSSS